MNNRLLTLFVCFLAFPLFAQKPSKNMQNVVQQKVSAADLEKRSKDAHDKAVFVGHIYVDMTSQGKDSSKPATTKHDFRCPAVRIDKNWLLMSSTCMFSGKEITTHKDLGVWFAESQNKVISSKIKKITVEGVTVKKSIRNERAKLIFIPLDSTPKLMEKLDKKGGVVANLLIAKNPGALVSAIDKAYINRPRGGFVGGHTSDRVGIDSYCTKDKCYKLEWELYDGTPGDPLFLLSKKHGKAEFLAGLNNAPATQSDTWHVDVSTSTEYRVFDANTLSALEKAIKPKDAAAFQRIQEHVVNELSF